MKVLILHKWLVIGGIERILINYLNLLKDKPNFQLDLLIAFDTPNSVLAREIPNIVKTYYLFDKSYYQTQQDIYKNRNKNIIQKIKYKLYRINEKRVSRKKVNKMISNYDIVINFSNHFDQFLNFKKIDIPIIRWQHSALENKKSKLGLREISYLKKYDHIVAICKEMKKDIQSKSGIASHQITYIYNPIDFENIKKLSEQYKINIEKPYLIQVARLEKSKNHIALIEIYAELLKKGVNHCLYIIGNGPEYNMLSQKIKQLNLEQYCILLGEINNPYPYIRDADLFLHTSEKEGLPTVLLESAILETPIVAMNCPTGVKEILNNGECGELISLGNNTEFIDKTYALIKNHSLQQEYKKHMKDHLISFSEKTTKKRFLSLLNSINKNK
ncbi:glycosyltransferase [Frederiksenia canicola]|uniref:Glycosyltransferase n=1 Tax=Frederiksenia canicola TaxID=123824 RepID=A0AAE7C247_9PAST|nr:glycosyltransferase [Frederiksenia canicola]QIM65040.1 glycosyltransferase [Frederiksenia canicola]RPE96547.1 glycosyltransferase involved in cell wall biosynthesis [Frederiksenia canicola]